MGAIAKTSFGFVPTFQKLIKDKCQSLRGHLKNLEINFRCRVLGNTLKISLCLEMCISTDELKRAKQKKCSLKKFGSRDLFDCRIEQIPRSESSSKGMGIVLLLKSDEGWHPRSEPWET